MHIPFEFCAIPAGGNQRDEDRRRAQNRAAARPKNEESSADLAKRQLKYAVTDVSFTEIVFQGWFVSLIPYSDAQIMQEKQKKALEKKAAEEAAKAGKK
jgi:hypothetical protein